MGGLWGTFFFVIVAILVYRFRGPIIARLKRFDDDNRARAEAQERETSDSLAHFRHTLALAEERVEQISEHRMSDSRTATPLVAYIFEGRRFGSRAAAEEARAEKVRAIARDYYRELPVALASRDDDGKLGR